MYKYKEISDIRYHETLGTIPVLRLRPRFGNGIYFRGWGAVSARPLFGFWLLVVGTTNVGTIDVTTHVTYFTLPTLGNGITLLI